ncbi:hypothetical protein DPMN_038347 [Dreissena polymorpha]|uniref:Uncharacterized protein n=1 Tax=Dreissena polymorpha TaxID=45954 RepID=A0A9D4RQL4_DREPO|nr:hypothetical protein DPMN_038347 [Dreissena polymorpha]
MGINWNARQDAPNVLVVFEGTRRLYSSSSSGTRNGMQLYFWEYTSRQTSTQTHSHRLTYTYTSGNTLPGKYVSLAQSQATHRLTYTVTDSLISSRNGLPGKYLLNTHKIR